MGVKRPLEENDFPELSFKQSKQHYDTLHAEDFSYGTTMPFDSLGVAESNVFRMHTNESLKHGEADGAFEAENELELSAPLSLVTSSGSEGDAGNKDNAFWSCFPEYNDFNIPRRPHEQYDEPYVKRPLEQFEDPYISLLNGPPRKEVPVGTNHQAELPQWDENARENYFSGSKRFVDDDGGQKFMGLCVIPFPDLNDTASEAVRVGRGRADCSCLDVGSMRCVKQHVKEARENLRETLGENTFRELGFYDMGEEVAEKWTTDEERVFHEVVYCNPVSDGRNFWKHLSAAFPTRTKMELVSYYFNVFILRRRAIQNRSYLLDIDSDDDEEQEGAHGDFYRGRSCFSDAEIDDEEHNEGERQGVRGGSYVVSGEEEDSEVDESFGDLELDYGWLNNDSWSGPENVCRDENSNCSQAKSDWNVPKQDAVEMGRGRDQMSGQDSSTLIDDARF